MKQLTDEQARNLMMMFDCMEIWTANDRPGMITELWETYGKLLDEISDRWYWEFEEEKSRKF